MIKGAEIYLGLGSNLGNRSENLLQALHEITQSVGSITALSKTYETAAWGVEDQPAFLNQALQVQSDLSPRELIKAVLQIEKNMGRQRIKKWHARLIDIDILFYGTQVIMEDDLKIPHPFLHQRNFVLLPLQDIAPNFIHPTFNKSIKTLYHELSDLVERAD